MATANGFAVGGCQESSSHGGIANQRPHDWIESSQLFEVDVVVKRRIRRQVTPPQSVARLPVRLNEVDGELQPPNKRRVDVLHQYSS